MGEFETIDQIKNVPIRLDDEALRRSDEPPSALRQEHEARNAFAPAHRLVFLRDIAEVKEGLQEQSSFSRYNGRETVALAIQKRAGANTVFTAESLKKRLKKIKENIPRGITIDITYDQSIFIKEAVKGVWDAAVYGGILAFLVLLFFLRSLRASLIVATAIPISVMFIFSAMYFRGITINMISLGGLALGIGMLVDPFSLTTMPTNGG